MRKFLVVTVLAFTLAASFFSPVAAAAGGAPAAHGLSGRDWGQAVSTLAQSAPGAMGQHASGK